MSATNKTYTTPQIAIFTINPSELVATSPGPEYTPTSDPTTNANEIGSNRREQSIWD